MEPFEKFIENWINILSGQLPLYLLLISFLIIVSFLLPLVFLIIPKSFFENRLKSGFSITFLTTKGALGLPVVFFIYLLGTALIFGIIVSIIRWALDLPRINVFVYYIIGLTIGYLIFMLILAKYYMILSRCGYYLGSEWLILKVFVNYTIVPVQSIQTLEIDPENLFIKIRYRTKFLYFFKMTPAWIFVFKDKKFYEKTITALKGYSIPIEEKKLKTLRLRLTQYYFPLIKEYNQTFLKKLPSKLQLLIEQE